jgi:chromosome segregation ATPase
LDFVSPLPVVFLVESIWRHKMSDFDELIKNLEYFVLQDTFTRDGSQDENLNKSRTALTDAISAVTSERDALKSDLIDAQQKCTMTEIHLSNELLHVDQLKEEQDKLEAKLAEANQDAERLSNHIRSCCGGNTETCPALELHRARLAKDES